MSTDEYTPTTEHVRSGFCVSNGFPAMTRRERGLGFDRWLAERDRQVAEQAGERIAAALVLTDAEWREFQQIPDQGYSHRAWLDARAARIARADSAAPARPTTDDRRWADKVADGCAEAARAALASRPTTPTPTVSEWGVLCSDDGEAIPSEAEDLADAERVKAHHDRNCGAGHVVVRREVTPWVPMTTDGGEE